jgi:L-fucose mutarotase/ribose pyranase (RbsD/FucU family)
MIKKSDRMRSVQAEQEIKSENKLFNTAIEKEAPQIQPIPFLKRLKFLFTNTL